MNNSDEERKDMKTWMMSALLAACSLAMANPKPNIVFIFIDDMGYGDIGPFGSTVNKTPELDRMAAEGMRLTDFYVSSTACTPSRSALMTGCYADRIGMDGRVNFPGGKRGLNPSEITIADLLKTQGYATGCFGKWQIKVSTTAVYQRESSGGECFRRCKPVAPL
jgi:arylsulfatase A